MERVKEGEKYWYVLIINGYEIEVDWDYEDGDSSGAIRLSRGNYFNTKEEAEVAAEKIRATLNDTEAANSVTLPKCNAITLMQYLDRNRPYGKMCLSDGECAQIDKAWMNGDWNTLIKFVLKYRKPNEE